MYMRPIASDVACSVLQYRIGERNGRLRGDDVSNRLVVIHVSIVTRADNNRGMGSTFSWVCEFVCVCLSVFVSLKGKRQ